MTISSGIPELTLFEAEFTRAGGTDLAYLRSHYARFAATKREFDHGRQKTRGVLLDIGAHWLHQAMLWALDGWRVVAMDLPTTFDMPVVHTLADHHAIRLLPNVDLEHPDSLAALADDSVDVVLFTEVIEHIAFNPVALWRAIHRVLHPGGIIIVTTPNYYALRGRAWSPLRFVGGRGGGITVDNVVNLPTLGHHWKEYSRKELQDYFSRLSADFRITKALHMRESRRPRPISALKRAVMGIESALPFLRPNLYFEIGLADKRHGVISDPGW